MATQIIIRAELEMLLCNGATKSTYALFDKKVPPAAELTKTDAIVQLAQRYFQSRGPATVKDFAWWSGLGINEAKTGIAELGSRLHSFTSDNLKYYHFNVEGAIPPPATTVTLLPCYDEYTVGYSEGRSIALPAALDSAAIGNGIFKPIVLHGYEMTGTWQKNPKTGLAEVQLFAPKAISTKNWKKERPGLTGLTRQPAKRIFHNLHLGIVGENTNEGGKQFPQKNWEKERPGLTGFLCPCWCFHQQAIPPVSTGYRQKNVS
ncbi:winged helix DNA-binding domain-containing protein [Niabella defluvii]|nr:winged helix DNA-binding domain-containing protein [Niabella sp. I65]